MPLTSRNNVISVADGPNMDAFSRVRVSNPYTVFDSKQRYGMNDLFWENSTSGGSVTNSLVDSSVLLSNGGTTAGQYAYRQTKVSFQYQPGKSQFVILTGVFDGGAVANVRRRYGYFNDSDGIYLELNGSTLNLVRRTSTSGAPVDTEIVPQSAWNIDKLDGTGPSRIVADVSKGFILVIDLQWLGMGRVRIGFDIGGVVVYVHKFLCANVLSTVYMASADLPIRCEIYNTGVAGSAATFRQVCATVISEGGVDEHNLVQWSKERAVAALGVTGEVPLISLRAKTTGPNGVRNTGQILFKSLDIMAATNPCIWRLRLNPGTLTGPAWTAFNASYSIAEYDITASAVATGLVIATGFVPVNLGGSRGAESASIFRRLPLVYSGLLSFQDVLSLTVESTTGTSNVNGSITWQEAM